MPFTMVDPRDPTQDANLPAPRVIRNPPLPPTLPAGLRAPAAAPAAASANLNVPVGQVAGSGSGSFWDALRALFSGQPQAQGPAQGMTGLIGMRGQGGPTTDALGNPFNRFG